VTGAGTAGRGKFSLFQVMDRIHCEILINCSMMYESVSIGCFLCLLDLFTLAKIS